jgi:rhamnogalacturonyl hydrolase YesR
LNAAGIDMNGILFQAKSEAKSLLTAFPRCAHLGLSNARHSDGVIMPDPLNRVSTPERLRVIEVRRNPMRCPSRSSARFRCIGLLAMALGLPAYLLHAQQTQAELLSSVGDAPTTALPLARDVSGQLNCRKVAYVLHKVADWQLRRSEASFNRDWTFATLYAGFMALPNQAGGKQYREAMARMANKFAWQPGPRFEHADDQAVGQTYLDLYRQTHDPDSLAPIRDQMNALMQLPDNPAKPLWWWCDALFMAPPVLAKLSSATGDRKYLNFMDREWWITYNLLYDRNTHLYYRDASFLHQRQANGNPLFWSRGNGWVLAGLTRVLQEMPRDYPTRARYLAQFQEMAQEIAALQGSDGLWRAGLLDPASYKLPENSGSAFYIYALAYGVNAGILDRKVYLPIIAKGWAGLVAHVYRDGRLGCIQPVGAAPGDYPPTASYVFGTGAFLLAGSEIYQLAH